MSDSSSLQEDEVLWVCWGLSILEGFFMSNVICFLMIMLWCNVSVELEQLVITIWARGRSLSRKSAWCVHITACDYACNRY